VHATHDLELRRELGKMVVRNLDEFYTAFGVDAGHELWLEPAARVRIW
jgi:predicted metalloendopeptidase